jgi:hypothetical protein
LLKACSLLIFAMLAIRLRLRVAKTKRVRMKLPS